MKQVCQITTLRAASNAICENYAWPSAAEAVGFCGLCGMTEVMP